MIHTALLVSTFKRNIKETIKRIHKRTFSLLNQQHCWGNGIWCLPHPLHEDGQEDIHLQAKFSCLQTVRVPLSTF